MATLVIEQSELDYYKSCADKVRRINSILENKNLSPEEKLAKIKAIIKERGR